MKFSAKQLSILALPVLLALTGCASGLNSASNPAYAAIATPPDAPPTHDVNKKPGENFDLSKWYLATGLGETCEPGLRPADLAKGATAEHFYTDPKDGAMVLEASGKDCITPNSKHPRTEFRELWKGDETVNGVDHKNIGWTYPGVHIMDVWASVEGFNTIVGQIHPISGGKNYPLLKCFYQGDRLDCPVELNLITGKDGPGPMFTGLEEKKPFFLRMAYVEGNICMWAGDNPKAAFSKDGQCFRPDASFLQPDLLQYFKIGNYNQNGLKQVVKIYYLNTYHKQ